jgi:HSP20 family protein
MEIKTAPDHSFQHISRNVNKIVEQMQKGYFNFRPNDCWAPNVNLYETDDSYLACIDLAGVDKEKIDIELTETRLTIRGSRNVPTFDEPDVPSRGKLRVHVMEIDHGAFLREVEMPEHVERDKIAAHYRNGLLWIEIPKK